MSQVSKGIFGAIALALTFGAIQLAAGRDLGRAASLAQLSVAQFGPLSFASAPVPAQSSPSAAVNRAGKSDRVAGVPVSAKRSQTISLRLNGLPDTSVLVRMPMAHEARNSVPRAPLIKPAVRKPMEACEPSVSVLTEVAKHLEPGRCVT
ncbi:MAG TPA: hypothetical protein VMU69_33365 [Bradyrhizobium sp.]|nr:hypothetical protein [Bradyrhizobium sp.]